MDPDETLKALRRAILAFRAAETTASFAEEGDSNDAHISALEECVGAGAEIVELVEALDEWMCKGGMKPIDWQLKAVAQRLDHEDIALWNGQLNELQGLSNAEKAQMGGEIHYRMTILGQRRPDLAEPLRALRRRVLIEALGMPAEMADKRLKEED